MTASLIESRPEIEGESFVRVDMTPAAVELLTELMAEHGPLMFHQSGGCCDGSSPMCYAAGEFLTSDADVLMGTFTLAAPDGMPDGLPDAPGPDADGAVPLPFWISAEQFTYWRHTRLTVDVVDGRGGGFSVEAPKGKRFLIRSTMLEEGLGAASFDRPGPVPAARS